MNTQIPSVLLFGRTNVGKSTLFNRIIGDKKSIIFNEDGVTRDYLEEIIEWDNKHFNLLDSGGIIPENHAFYKALAHKEESIYQKVKDQVFYLLNHASVIIFVCDSKVGVQQEDMTLAKVLHKLNKPVILAANKTDNEVSQQEQLTEFFKLGFKKVLPISAIHGKNITDLLDEAASFLPKEQDAYLPALEDTYKISLIGKPNVGKSSLMNILTQTERSIVCDMPGTTRETITQKITQNNTTITLADTPGIRKKSRVEENLEELMVKNSLETIRTSQLVILMVDASSGKLCDQDMKLLFYSLEQKKPTLLIMNKYDLLKDNQYTRDLLDMSMKEYEFIIKKVPIVNTSCITKKNTDKVLKAITSLKERCEQTFDEYDLNEKLKISLQKRQMFHKKMRLKVAKIICNKQTKTPTFTLVVNYPEWFKDSQLGYIENFIRYHYDLKGCPITLHLKKIYYN